MKKKIMALLMSLILSLGTVTAFASQEETQDNFYSAETIVEDGIEKNVAYFGDIKIVSWEEDDKVYVEQYDNEGNFVESAIGDRGTKELEVTNSEGTYTMSANEIVEEISTEDIPTPRSFSRVDIIKAINALNNITKTMYLYEELGRAKQTTYTVNKFSGQLASFIAGIATGLAISNGIANTIVSVLVSEGIGAIKGKLIETYRMVTLAAKKYPYSYYGKDKESGEVSKTYKNSGYKYVINDEDNEIFYDKEYFEGFVYNEVNSTTDYNLCAMIINNLYGPNYDVK